MEENVSDGLSSHSKNVVKINKVKKDVPFSTRYFNRPVVDTVCDSPTVTNEYYKEMCDINVIIANHTASGVPLPSIDNAIYNLSGDVDISNVEAIGSCVNFVDRYIKAKENFMTLPSDLRYKFNNDVAQFADFLSTSSDQIISNVLKDYKVFKEEVKPSVDLNPSNISTQSGDTLSVSSQE